MELKLKLFPNTYKTTAEADAKKPDFTGTIDLQEVKHQIAAWKNSDGSIAVTIKPKQNP